MPQQATAQQVRNLPMQTRAAVFQPSTYDEAARTIEVVWSTGAAVRRTDWWTGEKYDEELSMDEAHVDLSRLNSGAPILDTHGLWRLSDVIGVVEEAWLADSEGRARVRFSEREDIAPLVQDIRSGIIRNVSIGYAVRKFEVIKEDGQVPVYRAVDWQPYEISFVPVGADAGAGVRSAVPETPCAFISPATSADNSEERNMPEAVKKADEKAAADIEAARLAGAEAERQRVLEIREAVRMAKLDDAVADDLVSRGVAVDEARKVVLTKLAERSADHEIRNVQITRDERDTVRAAVESALLHRHNPGAFQLHEAGREWRGMTLMEMARSLLESNGTRTAGLSRSQLAERALHSSSDFPLILAAVANKTLRRAYEAAPRTFTALARQATAADFKEVSRTQLGEAPRLEKVNESGEFKRGTIGEARESYKLATYGKVFGITRQVLINDDLDAFTRLPELFGRAAADLESDAVWSVITGNPVMGDGTALFHANHGNLAGSGAAISVDAIGAGRAAMRKQKGLDKKQLINVQAAYLVVPAALETKAEQFVSTNLLADAAGNVNPFAGRLQVVAEPRLDDASATAWYLFADPGQVDTIEYAYLAGQEGVCLETRNGFDVDGMEIKARLDFAAKAIDWRGMFKNAGA